MEENNKDKKVDNQMRIELSEEVAEGIYSNLVIISHSSSEFVTDFVRILPNTPKAKVRSRIILTPENAKKLLYTLQDNIAKYEKQFGPIHITESRENNNNVMPLHFGNSGEA